MGLLDIFRKKQPQTLQAIAQSNAIDERIFGGLQVLLLDKSNPEMNERQMLDEFHRSPIFYACVSLIASQVAQADIHVVQGGEINLQHELCKKLDNPNQFHTRYTFLWLLMAHLLTTGNAYILVLENGDLIPISPDKVTHKTNLSYNVEFGYQMKSATLGVDLVKITMPDLREPYISGTGYGSTLGREIDISKAAQQHELATLKNNARPDLLVNLQGVQPNDLKSIKESWDRGHRGTDNSGKTAFMSAQGMTAITLGSSFKDLGFIDMREFSNDTIRRTFGIPPELLGKSENSNRSTAETAYYIFAMTVLKPRVLHLVSELNKNLLPLITKDRSVRLGFSEVVPDDKEFNLRVMQTFPTAFTINDVRKLAGFKPIIGGELPSTTQFAEELEEIPEAEQSRRANKPLIPMLSIGSMPEELWIAQIEREMKQSKTKC
jgi:HK97 family phage portal protein